MMSLPSSYRYRKTKRTRMNHLVECLSPKIVALRRLLILRNPKPPSEGASECGPSSIEKLTSDMTDGEWERLMPLIPAAKPGGGRATSARRSTPFRNFQRDGLHGANWERLHMDLREDMGCEASPTQSSTVHKKRRKSGRS
jgi:hypothetical protein